MQVLRWTVITVLMLGLPTWAVLGDVQQVTRFWNASPKAQDEMLVSTMVEPESSPPVVEGPTKGKYVSQAVFPELRDQEDLAAEPNGKPLRSAIYRPMAENNDSSYRRVPVKNGVQHPALTPSIEELESELRAMGPQRYRMDEVNGTYIFTCEFAPHSPGESQVTFRSESTSSEAAMQDAIAQAREWQRSPR